MSQEEFADIGFIRRGLADALQFLVRRLLVTFAANRVHCAIGHSFLNSHHTLQQIAVDGQLLQCGFVNLEQTGMRGCHQHMIGCDLNDFTADAITITHQQDIAGLRLTRHGQHKRNERSKRRINVAHQRQSKSIKPGN